MTISNLSWGYFACKVLGSNKGNQFEYILLLLVMILLCLTSRGSIRTAQEDLFSPYSPSDWLALVVSIQCSAQIVGLHRFLSNTLTSSLLCKSHSRLVRWRTQANCPQIVHIPMTTFSTCSGHRRLLLFYYIKNLKQKVITNCIYKCCKSHNYY